MPRQARLDIPGALHHIMVRGINKSKIFIDEECKNTGGSAMEVKNGTRRRAVCRLRAVIALRSRMELGLSSAEIARHLGVATSSISRSIQRIEDK